MKKKVLNDIKMYFPKIYETISKIDDIGFGEWFIETDSEQLIYDFINKTMRCYRVQGHSEESRKKQFGIRLRKMMAYSGVGQIELSEQTGISQSMISRYMNGRAIPTLINLEKIADALYCTLDDFRYR